MHEECPPRGSRPCGRAGQKPGPGSDQQHANPQKPGRPRRLAAIQARRPPGRKRIRAGIESEGQRLRPRLLGNLHRRTAHPLLALRRHRGTAERQRLAGRLRLTADRFRLRTVRGTLGRFPPRRKRQTWQGRPEEDQQETDQRPGWLPTGDCMRPSLRIRHAINLVSARGLSTMAGTGWLAPGARFSLIRGDSMLS